MTRNLLALLFVILVFITYGEPAKEDMENLKEELLLLNTRISKENDILKKKRKLIEELKRQKEVALKNEKKLFPADVNDSIALGEIQSFVKKIARDSGMDFVSSNWGEPVEKEGYVKLPISFILRGYPENVDEFLRKLYSYDRLLRIERITIGKFKKEKLVLNFVISAFKMEKKGEAKVTH